MKLVKKILDRLNGLHYKQEYLCMAKEPFQQPLHAYLVNAGQVLKDITKQHCFVGYSPLVFALAESTVINEDNDLIDIAFSEKILEIGSMFNRKEVVAVLRMKRMRELMTEDGKIIFYKGLHGSHRFMSPVHQKIVQLNNHLYQRKPGNVYLENNLYKQVQIAYSIPRKISLITVGQNGLYNLFPTDLHGQVKQNYYVGSLRHEGNACKQVESAKKIVLSDMDASAYKMVYAMGKNHMQPLKEKSAFGFSDDFSENFNLPLPKDLVSYKELELEEGFIEGIHKVLLFRIKYSRELRPEDDTLVHIHNTYATWRYKKGLQSNYLLR